LLLAVGAAGGGVALAVASVPGSNGLIHACVEVTTTTGGVLVPDQGGAPPDVTVIDPSAGQHCVAPDGTDTVQTELSWNALGRRGPQGPPGKSVTVAGGHTITLKGGAVVTVGSSKAVTINTPTLTPTSKPIGTFELGGSLKFPIYAYDVAGKGTATSGGSGGPSVSEMVVTKLHDSASAHLFTYCVKGTHFSSATIILRKAGKPQQEYLKIELKDLVLTSYQQSSGGDRPSESISINFTKIEYKNIGAAP
jgi:hypothetical protein